jgi:hypothetical protein
MIEGQDFVKDSSKSLTSHQLIFTLFMAKLIDDFHFRYAQVCVNAPKICRLSFFIIIDAYPLGIIGCNKLFFCDTFLATSQFFIVYHPPSHNQELLNNRYHY